MKRYSSPSEIKAAVIGYGGQYNMGRQHLTEMQKAGMTPTAVVELDGTRLALAPKDFPGIETYSSVDEMLAKSAANLITVITPHNTHSPLALQCLGADRHCVLEKPMAITTAECDTMIDFAKEKGLLVSTYHNRHWDGWIMKALEVVKSGVLGDVVRIELYMGGHGKPGNYWRSSKSISGGILYDWGVHLLEYALQIIDSEITEVSGYAWEGFWAKHGDHPYPQDANEDEAQLLVRFKSAQRINLMLSSVDANATPGFMEIVGTKGTHWIDWGHYVTTQALPNGEKQIFHGKNPPAESHRFYENIAAHLTKGDPLVITGEWARRPIHILDLGVQSAKQGKALPAKYQ